MDIPMRSKRVKRQSNPIEESIPIINSLVQSLLTLPEISDCVALSINSLISAKSLLELDIEKDISLYDDVMVFNDDQSNIGQSIQSSNQQQPQQNQQTQQIEQQPQIKDFQQFYRNQQLKQPDPESKVNDAFDITRESFEETQRRIAESKKKSSETPYTGPVTDLLQKRIAGVYFDTDQQCTVCEVCRGTVDSHPVDKNAPLSDDGRVAVILCSSLARVYYTRIPGQ